MTKKTIAALAASILGIAAIFAGIFLYERSQVAMLVDDEARWDIIDGAVKPVPVDIDVKSLGDGVYPVSFNREEVRRVDNGCEIEFEIFTMDLYDAAELHCLKVGDCIVIDGAPVKIDSLSLDGPVIINGGLDFGGAELVPVGGGVYRYNGWNDIATYSSCGKVSLTIPDSVDFIDRGNVSERMEGVVVPGGKVYDYLTATDFGTFSEYDVRIRVENGQVVEFYRQYRP